MPTLPDFLILLHNSGLVNPKLLVTSFFSSLTGYSHVHGTIPEQKSHGDFAFQSWFSWREACLVLIEPFHVKFYCNSMQVTDLPGRGDALQKGSGASRGKEKK